MENESISTKYLEIQRNLSNNIQDFKFETIDTIYNPLDYGYSAHEEFVTTFLDGPKKILFLGMNPGPYGMCQTAIPFGDPEMVQRYLRISKEVGKPIKESEHKKILGFKSTRKEISGHRLWSYFQTLNENPEHFFRHAFVRNFMPVAFLRENKNITPDELRNEPSIKILDTHCREALIKVIDLLQVEIVIALGRYAERIVKSILKKSIDRKNVTLLYLMHPSPRAKQGELIWRREIEALLIDNDLMQYFQ